MEVRWSKALPWFSFSSASKLKPRASCWFISLPSFRMMPSSFFSLKLSFTSSQAASSTRTVSSSSSRRARKVFLYTMALYRLAAAGTFIISSMNFSPSPSLAGSPVYRRSRPSSSAVGRNSGSDCSWAWVKSCERSRRIPSTICGYVIFTRPRAMPAFMARLESSTLPSASCFSLLFFLACSRRSSSGETLETKSCSNSCLSNSKPSPSSPAVSCQTEPPSASPAASTSFQYSFLRRTFSFGLPPAPPAPAAFFLRSSSGHSSSGSLSRTSAVTPSFIILCCTAGFGRPTLSILKYWA
mmetsp:Transcript_1647/g.2169  ORF Transcript_1647/g.2169 Transcript_1647/m.2169 type:complete len:298 (-) Transcript_1647:33-926(-)